MSEYADWLTKEEAASRLAVSTKTVERIAAATPFQRATRPTGKGAPEVVYHPEDVARAVLARRGGPAVPFLVPPAATSGNGHPSVALTLPPPAVLSPDQLVMGSLLAAITRQSQTHKLFMSLPEAAEWSGLTEAYLRRAIREGRLPARKDRGWKIRKTDLEAL